MGGRERDDDPVLDAVFMWFMRAGFAGFSMGDIAQTAGVPEHEIVNRGTRAELVVAAIEHTVPPMPGCPDTGTWRGDLIEIVHWQIGIVATYGPIVDRSIETGNESDEYAVVAREASRRRMMRYWPAFERAVDRGELDPQFDFDTAVDLLLGQVYARHIFGRPTGHEHAEAIVDLALEGLTANSKRP